MNIFNQQINLNVEQELLIETIQELALPFVQQFEQLRESLLIAFSNAETDSDFNKNHALREWLFAVMVTYKELETSIIYGASKKSTEMHGIWYDDAFNQSFYDAPCSFFANQSVSLAFSLGEKTAQLINIFENINMEVKKVSLFKLSDDNEITRLISPNVPSYKESKSHGYLKEIVSLLEPLKEIRHSKAHRLDSELATVKTTVHEGLKNDTEPITIVMSHIDIDRLPITPSQTIDRTKTFFELVTKVLDDIFNNIIEKL